MIKPPLDPNFQPAILWRRAFDQKVADSGSAQAPVLLLWNKQMAQSFTTRLNYYQQGIPRKIRTFITLNA